MSDNCILCQDGIDQTSLVQEAVEHRDDNEQIQWVQAKRTIEEWEALEGETLTLTRLKTHLQQHVEVVK